MSRLIKGQVAVLFALLTALVVTLAACGGGSSSTGGGSAGSGATVAGTVNDGVASVYPAGQERPLLVAIADTLVEPAHAAPVANVEVTLNCQGTESQTTTNNDGYFEFNNVQSGSCELHVFDDVIQLQVGEDSSNEVPVGGGVVRIEVTVQGSTVSGEIEDDASSDGISSDDVSSDDVSSDDDDSSADGVSDDDSLDDDDSSAA